MIPPRDKQGNGMTKLNNEIHELAIDELEEVSGGLTFELVDVKTTGIAMSGPHEPPVLAY
jgi:hypothetical protein